MYCSILGGAVFTAWGTGFGWSKATHPPHHNGWGRNSFSTVSLVKN